MSGSYAHKPGRPLPTTTTAPFSTALRLLVTYVARTSPRRLGRAGTGGGRRRCCGSSTSSTEQSAVMPGRSPGRPLCSSSRGPTMDSACGAGTGSRMSPAATPPRHARHESLARQRDGSFGWPPSSVGEASNLATRAPDPSGHRMAFRGLVGWHRPGHADRMRWRPPPGRVPRRHGRPSAATWRWPSSWHRREQQPGDGRGDAALARVLPRLPSTLSLAARTPLQRKPRDTPRARSPPRADCGRESRSAISPSAIPAPSARSSRS